MASTPDRGVFTKWLRDHMTSNGFITSIVEGAPAGSGWLGEMGADHTEYQAYTVISPLASGPAQGSIADASTDWSMPYRVTHYGVHVTQLEDLADDVRRFLLTLRRIVIEMRDTSSWSLVNTTCPSIGEVLPDQSVDPTAFSQNDNLLFSLSKNL